MFYSTQLIDVVGHSYDMGPLVEVKSLFMLVVDLGEGSKANFSDATWHIRLGHVNAADQVHLWQKCSGVA